MTANELIKKLRGQLGMTQVDFARAIKTSQGRVSKLESEKLPISLEDFRICAKLAFKENQDDLVLKFQEYLFD